MVYKTPDLRTLLYVRKWMHVKHALLDMHVNHALNVRFTCMYIEFGQNTMVHFNKASYLPLPNLNNKR